MAGDEVKITTLKKKGKGKVTFGDNVFAKIPGKFMVSLGNKINKE
jgi:hypothetical protein